MTDPAILTRDNIRLAFHFANRLRQRHRWLDRDACESVALGALARAARDFDPSRGFAFSTLASVCIKRKLHALLVREARRRERYRPLSELATARLVDRRHESGEAIALRHERVEKIRAVVDREVARMPASQRIAVEDVLAGRTLMDRAQEQGCSKQCLHQARQSAWQRLARAFTVAGLGTGEPTLTIGRLYPPSKRACGPLTARQAEILAFIRQRIEADGRSPTVREIAQAFGFSSPTGVVGHLAALTNKGAIVRTEGEARGIRLAGALARLG